MAGTSKIGATLILIALAAVLPFRPADGAEWTVTSFKTGSKPLSLMLAKRGTGLVRVHITTRDGGWLRLDRCGAAVCLKKARGKPPRRTPPGGALPDTLVVAGKRNIRHAWLTMPTQRYDHGVLGDVIEAGGLAVKDNKGKFYELELPLTAVFEDRYARLADLDGDGRDEIILVKSYLDRGAALAVAGIVEPQLQILAETPPIGRRHRWLNPAGIADFDGDGRAEIAIVVTPHIGGKLEFWEFRNNRLSREMRLSGFSNHVIGSRIQKMSAVADFDGDGTADIALPDDARRSIRIISLKGGRVAEPARIHLPGRAVTQVLAVKPKGEKTPAIVVGTDTGVVAVIRRTD